MSGATAIAMPDFSANAGAGGLPLRRPLKRGSTGDVDPLLLIPDLPPSPKPWKGAPILAVLLCVGFLMLQMMPATHYRLPNDPKRQWIPIPKTPTLPSSDSKSEITMEEEHAIATDFVKEIKSVPVDLFICTDENDLRPIVVVINSTLSNTRNPKRLKFHIVTADDRRNDWFHKLSSLFPDASIDMVSDRVDLGAIQRHISFRKDSKAREALASPYNFLPFYLPHMFPNMRKLVYLDSDVVVKADIEELFDMDLEGHAVAAVEDCSQKFEMYFDFRQLNLIQARETGKLPWIPGKTFDPKTCIFNRGVLLVNPQQWIEQNMTDAIEWWMEQFHQADKPLYKYGLSQPPFLLALYNNYKKLDTAWNTRGLGRNEFSEFEREYMRKLYSRKPPKSPFVSPNTDHSKILHFNGKFKPWKRDRNLRPGEKPASLCGSKPEDCSQLWWHYISPTTNDSLKPIT